MYTNVTQPHNQGTTAVAKSLNNSVRWMYRAILGVMLCLSAIGFGVAIWTHVVALLGIDPRVMFPELWIVQLFLFGLLLPIVIAVFHYGLKSNVYRSPRWARIVFYVFLAYYSFHFYDFLYLASRELTSAQTWRMFSAGWLLLFYMSVVYYAVRWQEAGMLYETP